MKILILEKNRPKEVRKVFEKWKKNKRAKKDIHRTFFYNEAFLKRTKRKAEKKERDGLMQRMSRGRDE